MSNGKLGIISGAILKEISRKKSLLETNPKYDLWRARNLDYFQTESARHSVSLELDGFDAGSGLGIREKAKERKFNEACLREAFNWGYQNHPGHLSRSFLQEVGRLIDPRDKVKGKKKNVEGFRGDREFVLIAGAPWEPCSPQVLERELVYFDMENSLFQEPLERSVHAHFHLIRIHPFNDGNGRFARAIGNIILKKEGLLPVIISATEKLEYSLLLDKAASSYIDRDLTKPESLSRSQCAVIDALLTHGCSEKVKEHYNDPVKLLVKYRMSPEQSELFNYFALKVRDSFDAALKCISRTEQKTETNFWYRLKRKF